MDNQSHQIWWLENQNFYQNSDIRFRTRDLKNIQKWCCLNFPTLFWSRQIFGCFQHTQKSSKSAISGSILHHAWPWCSRCVTKWIRVQLYLFPGDLDLERVCSCDSFRKIPTIGDRFLINILEKILVESKIANRKESIGMLFVFLAIFSGMCQIFGV